MPFSAEAVTDLPAPLSMLAAGGPTVLRAYEDAATAIGRLDAAGSLSVGGMKELLVLRCSTSPFGSTREDMVALLRPDGRGHPDVRAHHRALQAGAARARGGVVPSVALIHELLRADRVDEVDAASIDALLRDRTPPVLKAAIVAGALLCLGARGVQREARSALAVTLVLCVGGAITDAWLTLRLAAGSPLAVWAGGGDAAWGEWLGGACAALNREARVAERGLAAACERAAADEQRVRETLGRAAFSALDLLGLLRAELVVTVPGAARSLGMTAPTASAAVARLQRLGIAHEVTGQAHSRAFVYMALIDALASKAVQDASANGTTPS